MDKWQLAHKKELDLTERSVLMGIINMTPDSFSDGGQFSTLNDALAQSRKMLKHGAKIIDIGGESTRPDFKPVDQEEEQRRVLPLISALARTDDCLISIDTYHSATAALAVNMGAHIVNDIHGLQFDLEMAEVIASMDAAIVIMHNSRNRICLPDIIEDQKFYFDRSLNIAAKAGIKNSAIVLDPGFGFGKSENYNIALLARAKELTVFGYPLLAATSRKRFLGHISGIHEAKDRDIVTAASSVILRNAGFSIFRVHNVHVNRQALAICDAVASGV